MTFLLRKRHSEAYLISVTTATFFKPVPFFAKGTQKFWLFLLFGHKFTHFLVPFYRPKNLQISGMQTYPCNFFSKEKVFRGCGLIRRLSNFGNYWLANFPEASFQSTLLQILSCVVNFHQYYIFCLGPGVHLIYTGKYEVWKCRAIKELWFYIVQIPYL